MSSNINLGLPFSEGDTASNARRNAVMVMSATGSEISSVPITQQIPLFRCIQSENGYLENELYMRAANNLGVINVRRIHNHSAQTPESGGRLDDIMMWNSRLVVFGQAPFNNIYDFNVTKNGTADFVYTPDATYGRTLFMTSTWNAGGSIGYYVNAVVAGQVIGFSEQVLGIVKLYCSHNANQVARVGFGMEEANNTIDPTRKIGMEMCGSTGLNWQAVSANGITRTTSATSMEVAPVANNFKTYRMYFNPENVSYTLTDSDGVIKIVTSTIPSGGSIDGPRLFRLGLHTTNATTKNMWLQRLFFVATNADPDWFDGPTTE